MKRHQTQRNTNLYQRKKPNVVKAWQGCCDHPLSSEPGLALTRSKRPRSQLKKRLCKRNQKQIFERLPTSSLSGHKIQTLHEIVAVYRIPVLLPNDWEVAEIKKLKNKALQDDGGLRALHIFPCLQASMFIIYCI